MEKLKVIFDKVTRALFINFVMAAFAVGPAFPYLFSFSDGTPAHPMTDEAAHVGIIGEPITWTNQYILSTITLDYLYGKSNKR